MADKDKTLKNKIFGDLPKWGDGDRESVLSQKRKTSVELKAMSDGNKWPSALSRNDKQNRDKAGDQRRTQDAANKAMPDGYGSKGPDMQKAAKHKLMQKAVSKDGQKTIHLHLNLR